MQFLTVHGRLLVGFLQIRIHKVLTQEQAKELFSYDPEEGILRWRKLPNKRCKSLIAGYRKQDNSRAMAYWVVMVNYKNYKVHQIIWVYMTGKWPDRLIDHEDLNGENNKWSNLRLATQSQNMMNVGLRITNKTGVKGVSLDSRGNKFRARITLDRVSIELGHFNTLEEAKTAREIASKKYHGEFARLE